ncbi:ABC transporter permease [Enterococcus asini ATCC 700915]|uniref:ABC transporter permease n=2 Tax=Enterococcus asini TaxID=57732 RepID=R2Q630_9ENTE|nr:sugar ABC transporter permease [Enterococcus asini]EOH90743.1 ABC transporter permease [Enterococcus asini ATCC 700915]EOT56625.1 ABC transporter permease [Enterococcus asini ATCC 700915]MDT2763438.1 sugar ABC transporter permease [Enterococcus asini]MDT2809958.1 sugar ABC transporter permease [Enterococcus asini]OJG13474.1 ABC transporter permease [Enterococcus asini]
MEITGKSKAAHKLRRKNTLTALSFIAPNFIGFFLFTLIPVIFSLILAFMKWDSFGTPEFVGLKNFSKMLNDDTFWISLKNTFLYTIGVVPLTLICSLGLAILLNKKIRGMKFFRTAFFFPYVTSLVAIAVVWNMLFHPTMGPINQFLKLFIENPPGWTSSSDWALTAIVIVSVWRGMGYYMILYLAGLQSVPKELYEAASMDGAGKWKQFLNVTVPSLRPTTFFVTIMLVINCFKIFDLVQVMTAGGPGRATNVLVYQIYNEAFVKFNFGYASAIAMVLFVIVLSITVIQFKWNQRQERV